MASHPMDMSLSTTGWAIEPDLLNDLRLELVHSEQFGDCFLVKLAFKNDTVAVLEIEIKNGEGRKVYSDLTDAIRIPRMAPVITQDKDDAAPPEV